MRELNYLRDSTQSFLGIITIFVVMFAIMIIAAEEGRIDIFYSMIGIIFSFSLGWIGRYHLEIRKDEIERESTIRDLLTEVKQIPSLVNIETGPLYSSTWYSIKIKGIPNGINITLRKALADVFLAMEIFNEKVRRFEEYSIREKTTAEIKQMLRADSEQAMSELLEETEKTLRIAKEIGTE